MTILLLHPVVKVKVQDENSESGHYKMLQRCLIEILLYVLHFIATKNWFDIILPSGIFFVYSCNQYRVSVINDFDFFVTVCKLAKVNLGSLGTTE